MADLRIVDAPEIPTENITGAEKLPTGGSGNYSISLDSVADYTKTKKDLADNATVDTEVNGVRQELNAHIEDSTNPHEVTKGQIGLGNVDNTADADKPVSNSTQAAIISAVAPKADKSSVYTKSETYSRQETQVLVDDKISTALSPINSEIEHIERYTPLPYKLQNYAVGQRVTLSTGEIVENLVPNNSVNPSTDMLGWVKVNSADQIFDASGLSQQNWNNGVNTIEDMLTIQEPKNGNRVHVNGMRGGDFIYDASKSAVNDNGTIFNGWVRQYTGEVYVDWFGADVTGAVDCSAAVNQAYLVSRNVKFGNGTYLLTDVVGLPLVNNQGDNWITLSSDGATVKIGGTKPIFTSLRSIGQETSTLNLFTAKIKVTNIIFKGASTRQGVVFNLDRLYNLQVIGNTFYDLYAIGTTNQQRGTTSPYSQSTLIQNNHIVKCRYAVLGHDCYNFDFSHNMCEACDDLLVFQDFGATKQQSHTIRVISNMHEGGGIFLKLGHPLSGVVLGNYLESNTIGLVATLRCNIYIDPEDNPAFLIEGNTFGIYFDGTTNYNDIYVNPTYQNYSIATSVAYRGAIKISNNWTSSVFLINKNADVKLINNTGNYSAFAQQSKSVRPADEAKVSYWHQHVRLDPARISGTTITAGYLHSAEMRKYFKSCASTTMDIDIKLEFMAGNISVGFAALTVKVLAVNALEKTYTPTSTDIPQIIKMYGEVVSFLQADEQVIVSTANATTFKKYFSSRPVLTLTNTGVGGSTYHNLTLSNFDNTPHPVYGAITDINASFTIRSYLTDRTFEGGHGGALVFVNPL